MSGRRQFHLARFLPQGYGPKTWRRDWPGQRRRALEDARQGSHDTCLRCFHSRHSPRGAT